MPTFVCLPPHHKFNESDTGGWYQVNEQGHLIPVASTDAVPHNFRDQYETLGDERQESVILFEGKDKCEIPGRKPTVGIYIGSTIEQSEAGAAGLILKSKGLRYANESIITNDFKTRYYRKIGERWHYAEPSATKDHSQWKVEVDLNVPSMVRVIAAKEGDNPAADSYHYDHAKKQVHSVSTTVSKICFKQGLYFNKRSVRVEGVWEADTKSGTYKFVRMERQSQKAGPHSKSRMGANPQANAKVHPHAQSAVTATC